MIGYKLCSISLNFFLKKLSLISSVFENEFTLKILFSLSSSKLLKPSLNWFLFIISCIQSDVAHRCLPPQIQSFLPSIWFLLLLLFLCHHHLQRHLIFPLSCQWHNDKVVRSRKFPDKKGKNFQLWIICQIVDGKRNKT